MLRIALVSVILVTGNLAAVGADPGPPNDLAALQGIPVVKVGRDAPESFVPAAGHRLWIGGGNLTAAKARVLLMACLLRFGVLPAAADPRTPTVAERAAIRALLAEFQTIFDTH